MNPAAPGSNRITVRSPKGLRMRDALQIWEFRHLLWMLVWRDIKVRYRHTTLGILWFVLQPFILMLIISIGFRFVIPRDVQGLPYPLYVASGLVLWTYFANGFPAGSTSLESNAALLNKIAFPHACLPLVPVLTALVDMLAASLLLVPMLFYYRAEPSWRIVCLPAILLGMAVFVYGLNLLASAASAVYKDLRHLIPFTMQLMMFASPVFISPASLHGKMSLLFVLNPFAAYLEAFRWAIFPSSYPPSLVEVATATAGSLLLFLFGLSYFQRQQATLVDIL